MTARDDARDAGLLLRYGLDHSLSPARYDSYNRLLDRYQADPDLRSSFDEMVLRSASGFFPLTASPG
jgi:hypothetical protein